MYVCTKNGKKYTNKKFRKITRKKEEAKKHNFFFLEKST
jgi:hypothetical protein